MAPVHQSVWAKFEFAVKSPMVRSAFVGSCAKSRLAPCVAPLCRATEQMGSRLLLQTAPYADCYRITAQLFGLRGIGPGFDIPRTYAVKRRAGTPNRPIPSKAGFHMRDRDDSGMVQSGRRAALDSAKIRSLFEKAVPVLPAVPPKRVSTFSGIPEGLLWDHE